MQKMVSQSWELRWRDKERLVKENRKT